jgi:hypothetical protein
MFNSQQPFISPMRLNQVEEGLSRVLERIEEPIRIGSIILMARNSVQINGKSFGG